MNKKQQTIRNQRFLCPKNSKVFVKSRIFELSKSFHFLRHKTFSFEVSINRKSQIWITDFIIGLMIFSIGIILASRFIINAMSNDEFSNVRISAETMSGYLVSEGVPSNWTNETVVRIGLTTNKRLNTTKVSLFYNMTYEDTKLYLSTDYDYLLFFQQNNSIVNITKCGYGGISLTNCTVNISSLDYENLVKASRFTIYNNSIIEMVLYVWQ